jgi:hypothetical protein
MIFSLTFIPRFLPNSATNDAPCARPFFTISMRASGLRKIHTPGDDLPGVAARMTKSGCLQRQLLLVIPAYHVIYPPLELRYCSDGQTLPPASRIIEAQYEN